MTPPAALTGRGRGAQIDAIRLTSGELVLCYNDSPRTRNRLRVRSPPPSLALGGTHGALPLENLDNLYGVAPPHQTD